MATTKAAATMQASASNAAAATTTSTSVNLTTAYGAVILAKVTNGATGPTLPCSVTVNVSSDNATWKVYATQAAGTTLSTAYPMAFDIPMAVMYAQVVFTGNSAQAVTVEAFVEYVTAI